MVAQMLHVAQMLNVGKYLIHGAYGSKSTIIPWILYASMAKSSHPPPRCVFFSGGLQIAPCYEGILDIWMSCWKFGSKFSNLGDIPSIPHLFISRWNNPLFLLTFDPNFRPGTFKYRWPPAPNRSGFQRTQLHTIGLIQHARWRTVDGDIACGRKHLIR